MAPQRNVLKVVVMNPDERLWEGSAESVSSENSSGTFDILPQHANFVTIVRNKPITIRTLDGEEKKVTYKNAVLVIKEDALMIYTDI
jgi:F0F1-type ATP synthase epsilon subunit